MLILIAVIGAGLGTTLLFPLLFVAVFAGAALLTIQTAEPAHYPSNRSNKENRS